MASVALEAAAVQPALILSGLTAGTIRERCHTVLLCAGPDDAVQWRSQVYLLRAREEGFMAMFPLSEEVREALDSFEVESGQESVAMTQIDVILETTRGRALGTHPVFVADLPWPYLTLFRKCPSRVPAGTILFAVEGVAARPQLTSALTVADHWVSEVLDADTANEYISAAEMADAESIAEVPQQPAESNLRGAEPRTSEVEALHLRLAQLESLLHQRGPGPEVAPPAPAPQQRLLFDTAPTGELTPAEWATIKQRLGAAPQRLGKAEKQTIPTRQSAEREMLIEEVEKEVLEPDALGTLAQMNLGGVTDPLQKLLILQVLQTSDLVKSLAPRSQQDPLSAILGGSDSAAGSSGSGSVNVKGYAAREVYIKTLEDDHKIAETIRRNARQELGVTPAKEEPSLLRTYLEQRVPIGDHRLLGQLGFLAAWGWEQGGLQSNIQMQAFCGRLMMFVEQASLDNGRTNLAWLMTGLVEPNFQQMSINRRRQSLTPFGKLPAPTWVAANVSYLKDVDTFETRLRQIGLPKGPSPVNPHAEDEDKAPKPKRVPKKPKWGKGADAPSDTPAN